MTSYTRSNEREIEAERIIHERLVSECGPENVTWFAKSPMEFAPHDGLNTPGADGQVHQGRGGIPAGYHEVKSRSSGSPVFSFTRGEMSRILDCSRRGLSYHLWEVTFDGDGQPMAVIIPNIQALFPLESEAYAAAHRLFELEHRAKGCDLQI